MSAALGSNVAAGQVDGAPATTDLIERLENALGATASFAEADPSPEGVFFRLQRDYMQLARENRELRDAVKSQAPTVEMRVYGPIDHCAALLTGAWLLEQRGDKCAVAFKRDNEGHIAGLALSVEDL